MADYRTLEQLLTDFPDNVLGLITEAKLRNFAQSSILRASGQPGTYAALFAAGTPINWGQPEDYPFHEFGPNFANTLPLVAGKRWYRVHKDGGAQTGAIAEITGADAAGVAVGQCILLTKLAGQNPAYFSEFAGVDAHKTLYIRDAIGYSDAPSIDGGIDALGVVLMRVGSGDTDWLLIGGFGVASPEW